MPSAYCVLSERVAPIDNSNLRASGIGEVFHAWEWRLNAKEYERACWVFIPTRDVSQGQQFPDGFKGKRELHVRVDGTRNLIKSSDVVNEFLFVRCPFRLALFLPLC